MRRLIVAPHYVFTPGTGIRLLTGVHITNLAGWIGTTRPDAVLAQNRAFLVTFAHELIVQRSHRAASGSAPLGSSAAEAAPARSRPVLADRP